MKNFLQIFRLTVLSIFLLIVFHLTVEAQLYPTISPLNETLHNLPPIFFGYNGNNVVGKDQNGVWITWRNEDLRNVLPSLNATIIRFPAGGKAKQWDWNRGWYVDDVVIIEPNAPNKLENANCIKYVEKESLPDNGGLTPEWNTLPQLKEAVNLT